MPKNTLTSLKSDFGSLIKKALTPQELLVVQLALDEAMEQGVGLHSANSIAISTERYAGASGLEVGKESYLNLFDAVNALYENSISYEVKDGCVAKTRLISSMSTGGIDDIGIHLSPFVVDAVMANKGNYKFFNTKVIAHKKGMKGEYSKQIYDVILEWAGIKKTSFIDIYLFQEELGINHVDYLNLKQFENQILKKSLSEINKLSHLSITYESTVRPNGNPAVAFDITLKPITDSEAIKTLN